MIIAIRNALLYHLPAKYVGQYCFLNYRKKSIFELVI